LPVLFTCENNLYAMGTALSRAESVTDIARKAGAYGMEAEAVDGMDVLAVKAAAAIAVAAIRETSKPRFLEFRTYRFRAHSMFDPELYRTKAEVEEWKKRDPIVLLTSTLRQKSLIADADIENLEKDVAVEISDAVQFAEAGTWEQIEDLTRFVYTERQTA
jgi:TPP-dependent pyruvate/acetoin dehydrogenase alpha subunit